MNLISSSVSVQKYVMVPLVIVLLIGVLFWNRSNFQIFDTTSESINFFTIFVYVSVVIVIFHYINKYWSLMDKVWDSGNSLTFMKNGKEVEILYSQIKSFKIQIENEYEIDSKKEFFVKVDLSVNTKWGKSLRFMPATEGNVGRKPIAEIYEIQASINSKKLTSSKTLMPAKLARTPHNTRRPFERR